jgi:hypothetical protein
MPNVSTNKYYSGQGCLFVADRDAFGNILAYREVGNVSELSVTLDATVAEHKESCSGSRLTDARIVTELNASVSMTLQNFTKENLALLFSGDVLDSAGSTVPAGLAYNVSTQPEPTVGTNVLYRNKTASSVTLPIGTKFFLKHMNTSSVNIKNNGVNITMSGNYTLDLVTGEVTLLQPQTVIAQAWITADYTYAAYSGARMLKSAINKPRAFLFRGLNTADSNSKVRVELFNVVLDPAQSFDVLTEEFAEFQVEGSVLYDSTRDLDAELGPFGRVIGDANL